MSPGSRAPQASPEACVKRAPPQENCSIPEGPHHAQGPGLGGHVHGSRGQGHWEAQKRAVTRVDGRRGSQQQRAARFRPRRNSGRRREGAGVGGSLCTPATCNGLSHPVTWLSTACSHSLKEQRGTFEGLTAPRTCGRELTGRRVRAASPGQGTQAVEGTRRALGSFKWEPSGYKLRDTQRVHGGTRGVSPLKS